MLLHLSLSKNWPNLFMYMYMYIVDDHDLKYMCKSSIEWLWVSMCINFVCFAKWFVYPPVVVRLLILKTLLMIHNGWHTGLCMLRLALWNSSLTFCCHGSHSISLEKWVFTCINVILRVKKLRYSSSPLGKSPATLISTFVRYQLQV